jgi:ankyrin repeat protein
MSMGAHDSALPPPSGAHTAGELRDAIITGNDTFFVRVAAAMPGLLHQDQSWLTRACSVPSPNAAIVEAILRQRPELIHALEPDTANSALHCVCCAQLPSPDVARQLLSKGSNAFALNAGGMSAMHLALLNVNDQGVRQVLLGNVGASVLGQPTAAGESPAHLCAAHDRHLTALTFLKDNGAPMTVVAFIGRNADGRTEASTPLQKAVANGAELARRLLERC